MRQNVDWPNVVASLLELLAVFMLMGRPIVHSKCICTCRVTIHIEA